MTDDSGLVERARSGDREAFDELVRRHGAMAHHVALRIVRDPYDAQDVSQCALLSAWRGLAGFRGDAEFSSWLHQIVRRHALNWVARTRRADPLDADDLVDPARGPAELSEANDTAAGLYRAVATLPAVQRRALNLRHFEGRSYAEISDAIGSSVPAVRSHLYRARRALAVALAPGLATGRADGATFRPAPCPTGQPDDQTRTTEARTP